MDKYLLQILHEVNTIIIPGLGALTVTNKTTGEIMFMSYLKHNDGTLAKHIAEKEGISENDAKNLIAKYVRDIQAKLDTGDTYDMYQFGRFVKKEDGEIDFEQWNNYQHAENESFATEQVIETESSTQEVEKVEESSTTVEPEEKEEEKQEEVETPTEIEQANEVISELIEATEVVEEKPSLDDILNAKEESVSETDVEPSKEEEAIQEEIIPEVKQIVEEPKIDTSIIEPSENIYIPQEEIAEIAASQKAEKKIEPKKAAKQIKPAVKKEKIVKEKTEKKKRSAGFWVMISIGALLVLGGVLTVVFYDKIQHKFFANTEEVKEIDTTKIENDIEEIEKQVALEQEEENSAETIVETAESENPEKEVEKIEKTEVKTPSGDLSFHIIAGSFGVEENANRLAKKYAAAGKNASVLGKFDDMYLVSYESFATKEEAISALKSSEVKGWVFKYPK
ncbi:MAG: SPOR domain-containing protein [Flavobacteriia bacterium]|jgi:hypothetical protein